MRKLPKSGCASLVIYRIFKPKSSMNSYNNVIAWIGKERKS